jgi:UDP-glucose 4-epimerase
VTQCLYIFKKLNLVNTLVTGAAGFIGSVLASNLSRKNYDVVTIDNLSTGYEENIPSSVEFIRGDCHDPSVIAQLRNKRFDAIIHIAGQSSGEISFEDPAYDLQTNTQSTLMLLDYAAKTGCTKFIYASSMSVYGNSEEQPVHENMSLHPTSFYAVGKLASEHYLRLYSKFGINTTALRLFNVYGPGQNLRNLRQGMVSIYLAQAMKNKKVVVKGSGDRFRDLVYIDDVVDAFYKTLSIKKIGYNCYNIGSGEKYSVNNIIDKINNLFNYSLDVEFVESTPGDMFGIYSDSSLAERELTWKANVSFDVGIHRMFDWACRK